MKVQTFLPGKLLAAALLLGAPAKAAPPRTAASFSVETLRFTDPARANRTVRAKVCVPSLRGGGAAAGERAYERPLAPGAISERWPLYIVGHGFDCRPEDYAYFCAVAITAMVYEWEHTILDLDTNNQALDMAFLAEELPRQARAEPASLLYGRLEGPVILGGHSMGGGTTVLAAANHPPIDGLAVFAPGLYTIPNARPFLVNVSVPALIVSGSDDCGPNELSKEAQPAYDGLSSASKVLVVLKGANHCQWAGPSGGEIGVCNVPFYSECSHIDGETQRRLGVELVAAFLIALAPRARTGDSLSASIGEGWDGFERELALGEANGTWAYVSSKTSPAAAEKTLHSDCPCRRGTQMLDLVV